jgi:hypothetical protein
MALAAISQIGLFARLARSVSRFATRAFWFTGSSAASPGLLPLGWNSSLRRTGATSENIQLLVRFGLAGLARQVAGVPRTGSYHKRGPTQYRFVRDQARLAGFGGCWVNLSKCRFTCRMPAAGSTLQAHSLNVEVWRFQSNVAHNQPEAVLPRRSRKVTHLCSAKVTHPKNRISA